MLLILIYFSSNYKFKQYDTQITMAIIANKMIYYIFYKSSLSLFHTIHNPDSLKVLYIIPFHE